MPLLFLRVCCALVLIKNQNTRSHAHKQAHMHVHTCMYVCKQADSGANDDALVPRRTINENEV